ncbi:MAG TPA: TIM barrel protein [Chloroflexota bacterium]|nr:TIM barrel protein [Chloroflexota bacterium]
MLKYAVNISMIHADRPLRERLRLVAEAGFGAFEFWFPYQFDMDELARAKDEFGLTLALFDLEPDQAHPHGHLASPNAGELFSRNLKKSVDLARRLNCRRLNVLCGSRDASMSVDEQKNLMASRLRQVTSMVEAEGIILCLEGINRIDRPNAFLSFSRDGFDIVDAVGSPNVTFQYDIYHMQLMEGNLIQTIQQNIGKIGHIQVADPPGRHEPGTGEVNFSNVLAAIDATDYGGWISLEYDPSPEIEDTYAWLPREARSGAKTPPNS